MGRILSREQHTGLLQRAITPPAYHMLPVEGYHKELRMNATRAIEILYAHDEALRTDNRILHADIQRLHEELEHVDKEEPIEDENDPCEELRTKNSELQEQVEMLSKAFQRLLFIYECDCEVDIRPQWVKEALRCQELTQDTTEGRQ